MITITYVLMKLIFELKKKQNKQGINHCESLDSFNQIDVLSILNINIIPSKNKNLLLPDYNIQK